ncbi:MAG: YfcC family protein [Cyclobacteriaceae bacterium]|nr:YfcC family protein [Cyclobacteriaceae bacterium]
MKFKVPHTLVLLFGMMVFALLLTYVLPQGKFETIENEHGRSVVVPDSYEQNSEKSLLSVWTLFTVLPRAFADSQGIIFFVFIIGGALAVIKSTGVIDAFLGKMLKKFGSKPQILIVSSMLVFSIGSSTLGMAEEYLPFITVLIALCLGMKMDVMSAVGIMVVGYGVGYGVAAINPFTVMIAQEVAEVPPTSGMWYRLILLIPFFLVGWYHVQKYAIGVQNDPSKSLMNNVENNQNHQETAYPKLTKMHWIILILTFLALSLIVYGISAWHWYLTELGAVFFGLTVLVVIVNRINPSEAAKAFGIGASELTLTALLIGFARSIALLLEDGQVLHTIVNALAIPLQKAGPELASVGMYMIQSAMNFFIPSGSGQAYVTMPLMAPIADLTGVSRQIAVLAYQFGDGFTNMLVPTNAVLMGIIGIAGIPYDRWFKFIIPLMIKFWIIGSLALILAVWIGYS